MPTSYSFFKPEIKQWFLDNIPRHKRILDVGPGEGIYSHLLRSEGYRIDAVEIYEPYVDQFNLREKYDNVYIGDILNFDTRDYDVIILGDVLEHIIPLHAQALINKIKNAGQQCLVAVPYMMPQGEYEGNIHEAHKQEDLTHDVMLERYSHLECLYRNNQYGYYALPDKRNEKAFVLYATESYLNTVQGAVDSIRAFSNIPIIVYTLNCNPEINGATVESWECDIEEIKQQEFISRTDSRIYNILIQRPRIIIHALNHYAKTVAYIDADSVATPNVENIFALAKDSKLVPYFTQGIYDYLYSNGRGGTEFKKTLESPACWLFGVPPDNRLPYRQTGYFVANECSIPFLEEWSWMCNHPEILKNPQWYAAFHEETILNVLLWKHRIKDGLPLIYMNVRGNNLDKVTKDPQWGKETAMWIKYPEKKEHLLFYHGEKDIMKMNQMTEKIRDNISKLKNVKIVEGYPNYSIDIKGTVINVNTNNEVKSYLNQGRWMVELWKDNTKKHYHIHRLLAENFMSNPEDKPQVNHIDGNPQNNNLDNLEWVTDRENKLHAYQHGLMEQAKIPVVQYALDGQFIEEYESILAAHNKTKIDRKTIQLHLAGEYKQAGGYLWKMKNTANLLKILYLAPHLSTGGMPAFLLKRIEALQEYTDLDIYVVEFKNYSPDFVVQKNKIMKIVKNFVTLGDDKMELIKIIKEHQIDVVHVDEMIEGFDDFNKVPEDVMNALYATDRQWKVVETCHNIIFNPDNSKRFHPDAYAFCTPFHLETFKNMKSMKAVIPFPIDDKTPSLAKKIKAQHNLGFDVKKRHVVNIGLWTPGKNQGEGIEIARRYPNIMFHFVGNQAGNFQNYWQPLMANLPENVVIWGERTDIQTFLTAADLFMFNSTWECNPLVLREAISYHLPIISRNLPQYGNMFDGFLDDVDSDLTNEDLWEVKYDVPTDNESMDFAMAHKDIYSKISNVAPIEKSVIASPVRTNTDDPGKLVITRYYVDQPYFKIENGNPDAFYQVKFYDEKNNCVHQQEATVGTWISLNRKWFTRWRTEVLHNDRVIYNETLNYEGGRVLITFDSSALGDTLAWIPYCRAFKEKHDCHVIVSTHHNRLFKDVYDDIEFVEPGSTVTNLQGQYHLGSHNEHKPENEPQNTINIPLQKVACNILGLEYEELRPSVSYREGRRAYKNKYVSIATNSTAGCKFWQKEDWQAVIDFLVEQGYQVINVSKERNDFNHCTQILNDSMNNTMNVINYSEFYIGLSSGLSWLAWAMSKPVVMIANFTSREYEFDCIRMSDESVCHGCFNNPAFKFDKGDFDWCPLHKGTDRQWECQKAITAKMVIDEIKKELL